jgi:Gpi18-like mannosyltransferase
MKRVQSIVQRSRVAVQKLSLDNTVIVAVGVLLAVLLRYSLRGYASDDFTGLMNGWYQAIKEQGLASFRTGISNYNPPYLYLLYIISLLFPNLYNLTAVKLPSILGDFLCAWFVYRTVRLKFPAGPAALFAFFAVLFAPTVVLNSAFWGQIDVLFTTGLIACVYYTLKNKGWLACLWFGIAISFKFQALFLAPFLLVMLLKRKIPWKCFLLVPAVYLLSILPAWIAGRPLLDLLSIFSGQVDLYSTLTNNVANMYAWFPKSFSEQLYPGGLLFGGGICFVYLLVAYKSRAAPVDSSVMQLALLSVLLLPFFLPRMHDRYFYPADILSILYAFFIPEYFLIPLLIGLVSFFSYEPYLFKVEVIPFSILAIVLLGVIIVVVRKTMLTLYPRREEPAVGQPGSTGANPPD